MNTESTLSLTIMVIIMALLAIFIGYLLGNWLIQFVTGDGPTNQQLLETGINEEEIIGDEPKVDDEVPSFADFLGESAQETSPTWDEDARVYVVQVGAFNNYLNAVTLKNELIEKGFQPVINDDTLPYKVQLGASNKREDAEKVKEDIKNLGYDAFVTH